MFIHGKTLLVLECPNLEKHPYTRLVGGSMNDIMNTRCGEVVRPDDIVRMIQIIQIHTNTYKYSNSMRTLSPK